MRLWTWQKQGFSPDDKNIKVESLENSMYLNNDALDVGLFKRVYNKLWEKLETCQFHWYYTEESEAKDAHHEYPANDRMLWEVNVPDDKIFGRVCEIAWNCLLKRQPGTSQLSDYWKAKALREMPGKSRQLIKEWEQNLSKFWKRKSEDELWDLLLLDKYVEGCTQILLCHPLKGCWIERNPIVEGEWWEISKGNKSSPGPYTDTLPCRKCSGRT